MNMGNTEDAFYDRLERKQAKRRERMKKREALREKRKPLIQSVKDGKITLDEAKGIT
ncbi:unnamed protein product [marine sediment metagenome]|uniref:Uncharacterized protein n=1 Tax=marine sediment metagenome TaxID=412755 RepID=X0XZ83_9ZZZZ